MNTANDIALDLASAIALGKVPPDWELPHRKVVAKHYQASLATMYFALDKLQRCGLLVESRTGPKKLRVREHLDETNEVILLCRAAEACTAEQDKETAAQQLAQPVRAALAHLFSEQARHLVLTGQANSQALQAARSVLKTPLKRGRPAKVYLIFPLAHTVADQLTDAPDETDRHAQQ